MTDFKGPTTLEPLDCLYFSLGNYTTLHYSINEVLNMFEYDQDSFIKNGILLF